MGKYERLTAIYDTLLAVHEVVHEVFECALRHILHFSASCVLLANVDTTQTSLAAFQYESVSVPLSVGVNDIVARIVLKRYCKLEHIIRLIVFALFTAYSIAGVMRM